MSVKTCELHTFALMHQRHQTLMMMTTTTIAVKYTVSDFIELSIRMRMCTPRMCDVCVMCMLSLFTSQFHRWCY